MELFPETFVQYFKGGHVDFFCPILLMLPKAARIPSPGAPLLTFSFGMSFLVFGEIRASLEGFPTFITLVGLFFLQYDFSGDDSV